MSPYALLRAYAERSEWHHVRSSNVDAVAYWPDFRRLFVRFLSGSTYSYEGVGPRVYERFLNAPSKGVFVHQVIRNFGRDDVYPCRGPL